MSISWCICRQSRVERSFAKGTSHSGRHSGLFTNTPVRRGSTGFGVDERSGTALRDRHGADGRWKPARAALHRSFHKQRTACLSACSFHLAQLLDFGHRFAGRTGRSGIVLHARDRPVGHVVDNHPICVDSTGGRRVGLRVLMCFVRRSPTRASQTRARRHLPTVAIPGVDSRERIDGLCAG